MKHRLLITALASVMLAGTASTVVIPTQYVQAISKRAVVSHVYKKSNPY